MKTLSLLFTLLISSLVFADPCEDVPVRYNLNNGKFTLTVERIQTGTFRPIPGYNLSLQCNRGTTCNRAYGLPPADAVVPTIGGELMAQSMFISATNGSMQVRGRTETGPTLGRPQAHIEFSQEPIPGCGGKKRLVLKGLNGTSVIRFRSAEELGRSTITAPEAPRSDTRQ